MIHADCQPGVAARTLDSTIQNLRQLLTEYRSELSRSETAFDEWELRWNEREREIDTHLSRIQSRLEPQAERPALSIVTVDE
ncbi:MAG: hypothetical protein ACK5Q5_08695 [Planctomycetaceae bacterium]